MTRHEVVTTHGPGGYTATCRGCGDTSPTTRHKPVVDQWRLAHLREAS